MKNTSSRLPGMYFRLLAFIAAVCILIGFIFPWLFSAHSDAAIIVGFLILVFVPVGLAKMRGVIVEDIRAWKALLIKDRTLSSSTPDKRLPETHSSFSQIIVSVVLLIGILGGVAFLGFKKVEAGYVGVKVYLLGGDKGVDSEVLGVGRYWIGWNEELFLFPTFQQTAVWSREKGKDDSLTFQTREGLSVNGDVSISYTIDSEKVSLLFQRYRKGVDEITNTYLRNIVRDALVQAASTRDVESIYGEGKSDLIETVKQMVTEKMSPVGVIIDYVSFVGDLRLPKNVIASINAKIEATQKAQQRENELREAEAQAKKDVARAEGEARARLAEAEGEARARVVRAEAQAKATVIESEAQAKANTLLAKSLTPELVQYLGVQTWNGQLPQVSGGNTPIVSLPGLSSR